MSRPRPVSWNMEETDRDRNRERERERGKAAISSRFLLSVSSLLGSIHWLPYTGSTARVQYNSITTKERERRRTERDREREQKIGTFGTSFISPCAPLLPRDQREEAKRKGRKRRGSLSITNFSFLFSPPPPFFYPLAFFCLLVFLHWSLPPSE